MTEAQLELRALRSASDSRVAIGCGTTGAVRLLPQAVARLRAERPEVRLQVLHGMSEALMPWVRDGTIDFALSSVPVTASDPALEHLTLYFGKMAVVARAGHPLAARRSLTLAELAGYPWCLAGRREMERRALDELFLDNGLKPPEAGIETTSTALMVAMVMGSDHLSFLPQELVYWEQDGGRLVALPVAGSGNWQRGFGITRRRARPQSTAATAAIQALARSRRTSMGRPRGSANEHRFPLAREQRAPRGVRRSGGVRARAGAHFPARVALRRRMRAKCRARATTCCAASGPEEVLLVRREDGGLSLLHNRCAHRGARIVAEPAGNARQLRCPYHAWTYAPRRPPDRRAARRRLCGEARARPGEGGARRELPRLRVRLARGARARASPSSSAGWRARSTTCSTARRRAP